MSRKKKYLNNNSFEPIVVSYCLIEPNTIYEVVPRDPSGKGAPDIYKEMGSSKERHPHVSNTVELSQDNTGFFSTSPYFNDMPYKDEWDKREQIAEAYYEIFAEPLRNIIPDIERIRIPTDKEFFDRMYNGDAGFLRVSIGEGYKFDTSKPLDRFRLYVALMEGQLCMKGVRSNEEINMGLKEETDPYFVDAQYSYISVTQSKAVKEAAVDFEMRVMSDYFELYLQDRPLLLDLLNYLGIYTKSIDHMTKTDFNVTFNEHVRSSKETMKRFALLVDRLDDPNDNIRLELDLRKKINSKRGKELVKKKDKDVTFYFDNVPLGSNIKSIVATFMKSENSELLRKFEVDYDFV